MNKWKTLINKVFGVWLCHKVCKCCCYCWSFFSPCSSHFLFIFVCRQIVTQKSHTKNVLQLETETAAWAKFPPNEQETNAYSGDVASTETTACLEISRPLGARRILDFNIFATMYLVITLTQKCCHWKSRLASTRRWRRPEKCASKLLAIN